jgi:hypothetical protein
LEEIEIGGHGFFPRSVEGRMNAGITERNSP